jgi:hypothetical protein
MSVRPGPVQLLPHLHLYSSTQYNHKLDSHPSALVTQLMKKERTKRRLKRSSQIKLKANIASSYK